MIDQVTDLLERNNINLHQIHRKTGISMSTLSTTFSRPVRTWKVGIIQKLANVLHSTPSKVIGILLGDNWHLVCNDKKHTIQGVPMSDRAYSNIKSTVITECYEGWQPDNHDIKLLVHSYSHPSKDIMNSIKEAKVFVNGKK